jgi:hypothetical protein
MESSQFKMLGEVFSTVLDIYKFLSMFHMRGIYRGPLRWMEMCFCFLASLAVLDPEKDPTHTPILPVLKCYIDCRLEEIVSKFHLLQMHHFTLLAMLAMFKSCFYDFTLTHVAKSKI